MIKEDYCSYEVAKLLKEKGFNEPLRCWYDNFQNFHEEGVRMSNTDCLPPTIMCPTHQMAMKWLREYIKFFIEPYYVFPLGFLVDIKYIDRKTPVEEFEALRENSYNSYEEAVETALKYVLKNLI